MTEYQPYSLQAKQQEFHEQTAKYRLYGGANGGGKSYAMRAEAASQCCTWDQPINGLLMRRTLPEVKKFIITKLEEELPPGSYRVNHTDNILTFLHNNSTITFGSAEHAEDLKRWQGGEFDFIGIDELTQWEEGEVRTLLKSLRSKKKGWRANFFGTCNPGGIGHRWVKRLWVDRQFKPNERPEDYAFVPARVWDNDALLGADPDYISVLQALPEKQRRAALEGDWNVFEGQFFDEWRDELLVVAPFVPVGVKRRIIAIDYGYGAPSCVLWGAIDTQGRVWVYRELYENHLTYSQLALKIAALTPAGEKIDYIVVDPAALEKKSESDGTSMHLEFVRISRQVNAPWLGMVQRAKNDRKDGWNLVRRYIQPVSDPNAGGQTTTMLKITRNCANSIRSIPEQVHDTRDVEDMNTKGEDHPADTLRYLLMEFGNPMLQMSDVLHLNAQDPAQFREAQRRMEQRIDRPEEMRSQREKNFWKPNRLDDTRGSNMLGKQF